MEDDSSYLRRLSVYLELKKDRLIKIWKFLPLWFFKELVERIKSYSYGIFYWLIKQNLSLFATSSLYRGSYFYISNGSRFHALYWSSCFLIIMNRDFYQIWLRKDLYVHVFFLGLIIIDMVHVIWYQNEGFIFQISSYILSRKVFGSCIVARSHYFRSCSWHLVST